MEGMTEEEGNRGLVRAILGNCTRNDDKEVEGNTKRGETEDNRCDGRIDLPK